MKKNKNVEAKKATSAEYFAERLKTLLKLRGKTFNELAESLDISSNGLYLSVKRGKVTIETIDKIAEILEVEPFYFFEMDIFERLSGCLLGVDVMDVNLGYFLSQFMPNIKNGESLESAVFKSIFKDVTKTLFDKLEEYVNENPDKFTEKDKKELYENYKKLESQRDTLLKKSF